MGTTDEEAMLDKIRKLLESAGLFSYYYVSSVPLTTRVNTKYQLY